MRAMTNCIKLLTLVILILTVLVSCTDLFGGSDDKTAAPPPELRIESVVAGTEVASASQNADLGALSSLSGDIELWVMSTRRGTDSIISEDNVSDIRKFEANRNGSFTIPRSRLPNSTFVVFVMDVSTAAEPDVMGFLTLEHESGNSVIEFDSRSVFGNIDFGSVRMHNYTYMGVADRNFTENRSSFGADFVSYIQQTANFQNAAVMTVNILRNTNASASEYYIPSMTVRYSADGTMASVESSGAIGWEELEFSVYSHNSVNNASLYRPDDSLFGDAEVINNGSDSAVKWSWQLALGDITDFGDLWDLKIDDKVVATFDMSVAIILDDNEKPLVPIPAFEFDFDANTMDFRWMHFGQSGTEKTFLTDLDVINTLIGQRELNLQMLSYTYMFRAPNDAFPGYGSMSGNLVKATGFSPAVTLEAIGDRASFGYRFGLYSVSGSLPPPSP